jgi:hypothetical protein
MQYNYDVDGNIQFYKSDYFHIWLETMKLKNLSKNDFAFRFISYVKQNGAKYGILVGDGTLIKERNKTKKQIKQEYHIRLAGTEDIDDVKAYELRENAEDIDVNEKFQLRRYDLRKLYTWEGEINQTFVEKYDNPKIKSIFRNLRRLFMKRTMGESLEDIRQKELARYDTLMKFRSENPVSVSVFEGLDVQKQYTYDKLSIGFEVLSRFGFTHVTDDNAFEKPTFDRRLIEVIRYLSSISDKVSFHIGLSTPAIIDLRFINKILKSLFGVSIEINQFDYYFIHTKKIDKLFSFDYEDHSKPCVKVEVQEVIDIIDDIQNEKFDVREMDEILEIIDA